MSETIVQYPLQVLVPGMSEDDHASLVWAHQELEHPSLAARLTSVIGTPIEVGFKLLPANWYAQLHRGVEKALGKALDTAISTLDPGRDLHGHVARHRFLAASTGAAGGFFGLPGLLVELPITTTIMLRAIASVARSEGEDLADLETRMACIQVFALGARTEDDDAAETGYFSIRLALALSVSGSMRHIATQGLTTEGAPLLARMIALISSRFGIAVSNKAAAQVMPVIGAAGGALINTIFVQHFTDAARAHFIIRRLERTYGEDRVRVAYEALDRQ
ncbi:EcsC family protein [Thioalkalivibrio sulfidiphilus]|uniref:EcsC family protein n=1 Tax=Thioalkalivibrio sulfidiphilus TaxID=1033854 RepID=UPI000379875E|nr:EcsC family protein [Thioalkalivibrio sulfidiphilus]